MSNLRIGIVGLGNMGRGHAQNILAHKVDGLELTAITDVVPPPPDLLPGELFVPSVEEMIGSGKIDALLIATPHYSHTAIGIAALKAGLHVVVEKPISVHKADAEKLMAAHTNSRLLFAAMFNQRTDPYYAKIREMIRGGTLGPVRRINWTITNWFRSAAYYASGSWRATWAGEGGGILLNQCPHNLDLYSWLFGQPKRVRAFCRFGQYHDIEVEDDVTAYFEHDNGATATFIATTGEAPGVNRLEIAAENGLVVLEGDKIVFIRNEVPTSEFSRTTKDGFKAPNTTEHVFTFPDHGEQHVGILRNFVEAVTESKPLLAPAAEGIYSVELANAMLLSTFEDRAVELPLDGAAYEKALQAKIDASPRTPRK
jgi:predicted dehydrogenase